MRKLTIGLIVILLLAPACALAFETQTPCIAGPYDYEYQDESKQIFIQKFAGNGVTYFIADVQLSDVSQFRAELSGDAPYEKRGRLSKIASRNGAVLAVNGDDFGTHRFGTVIRNGELLRTNETTRHMLIVDSNGDLTVRSDRKNENPAELGKQLIDSGAWQTFEFGPALVSDSQKVKFDKSFDLISLNPSRREPRCAIGQLGTLHYIVIVADGRQKGYSKGMTLPELQQLFVDYGTTTAINLDGGGSAEMWFNGEIISKPSSGKERGITDCICF